MNQSKTPRTDADERMAWDSEYMVPPETARELERELTAMTEQRDNFEERLRVELGGHPDSELWGDAGLIAATMRCVDALNEITDQRDRLAEALRRYAWPCSDAELAHHCASASPSCSVEAQREMKRRNALQSLTPNAEP
jgi:hypothetical protein